MLMRNHGYRLHETKSKSDKVYVAGGMDSPYPNRKETTYGNNMVCITRLIKDMSRFDPAISQSKINEANAKFKAGRFTRNQLICALEDP